MNRLSVPKTQCVYCIRVISDNRYVIWNGPDGRIVDMAILGLAIFE